MNKIIAEILGVAVGLTLLIAILSVFSGHSLTNVVDQITSYNINMNRRH